MSPIVQDDLSLNTMDDPGRTWAYMESRQDNVVEFDTLGLATPGCQYVHDAKGNRQSTGKAARCRDEWCMEVNPGPLTLDRTGQGYGMAGV